MTINQLIRSEFAELDWKHNKWPLLFGLVAISPALGFIPSTQSLYYVLLVFTFLLSLKNHKQTTGLCFIFFIACLVSIVLNASKIAPVFTPWTRLGLFAIVFSVGSPLMQSEKSRDYRLKILHIMVLMCVLIAVGSFVGYFFGINYMRVLNDDSYINTAGIFGGLTRQSMLLGPMSGIGTVYCGYKALTTKSKLYWLIAIPCAACTMFSASRAAFLSAIAGILAVTYAYSRSGVQFIKTFVSVLIVGSLTFPLWNSALDGLEEKNERNISSGSQISSREGKWDNRIEEFHSSPLCGIGFCTVDPKYTEDYNYNGGIETGSSWLSVLSMTGLCGFIPFCILVYQAIVNVWKRRTRESALLMGLIAFVLLHMLAEGYIFFGGSSLCFLAWLIIACSYDNKFRPVIA